ncbi:MAG: hypothetical protein HPY62_04265 [Bacteroidales bacterium]|nr:hypothetical protein [Bacteroidales bacterium]
MSRQTAYRLRIILLFLASAEVLPCYTQSFRLSDITTLSPDKMLLNGRIWMNQYSKVTGTQFYLTDKYLKGSVYIKGHKYDDLDLRYDICNDELVLKYETWPVIYMNKELVDSFSVSFDRTHKIINTGINRSGMFGGYVNLLYSGPTSLYVKYTKKIYPLGDNGLKDLFVEKHYVFLKKNDKIVPVSNSKKFLKLLNDKKKEVRHFIKSKGYRVSSGKPETFVPILEFYDSLTN